jgi:small subunit ribosomal protein S9
MTGEETGALVVEPPTTDLPTLDVGSQAGASDAAPRPEPVLRGRIDIHGIAMGTGRRKTAVARVRISDGNGDFTVNGRPFEEYFPIERDRQLMLAPLVATGMQGKVNIEARVDGGGPTGQTGAVVLGVARALQTKNPSLHEALSEHGFLTRDGRAVERKKYGFKKARRSFQFSKR